MQNCSYIIHLLTCYLTSGSENNNDNLLQTIRFFINNWDGRCYWLQTTAKHDVVWNN